MSEIPSAEFRVKEEYFWWRVASLTSLPVCFLATARYGFTCFDHWFSGHHVIVLDDSGKGRVVSLRYDKKKVWLTRILTYLVSRSFQNPVLITLRCKVVSFCCDDEGCLFTLWSYKQRLLCYSNYYSILETDDVTFADVIDGMIT